MDEFVLLEGDDLKAFMGYMLRALGDGGDVCVRRLRLAVDGGIKVKVNEYSWTPAYGEVKRAE